MEGNLFVAYHVYARVFWVWCVNTSLAYFPNKIVLQKSVVRQLQHLLTYSASPPAARVSTLHCTELISLYSSDN